jgi:hypothetical protein
VDASPANQDRWRYCERPTINNKLPNLDVSRTKLKTSNS